MTWQFLVQGSLQPAEQRQMPRLNRLQMVWRLGGGDSRTPGPGFCVLFAMQVHQQLLRTVGGCHPSLTTQKWIGCSSWLGSLCFADAHSAGFTSLRNVRSVSGFAGSRETVLPASSMKNRTALPHTDTCPAQVMIIHASASSRPECAKNQLFAPVCVRSHVRAPEARHAQCKCSRLRAHASRGVPEISA